MSRGEAQTDLPSSRPLLTSRSSLPTPHSRFLIHQHALLNTQYSILNTQYSILNTQYSILNTHYSLVTTRYSLLTTHYSLLTTHCSSSRSVFERQAIHSEAARHKREWRENEARREEASLFRRNSQFSTRRLSAHLTSYYPCVCDCFAHLTA